jgi:signal transduction histidine kinase
MELGADDYITKPFTLDEIINAINSRLEKQAAQNNLIQAHLDLLGSVLSDEREKRLLKSRLVAMFSHDFRNPLSAIKSSIELLLAYDERLTPEHRHGYLERMDYSVRQLLQMLDDVVLVAQIESGSFECAPQPLDVSAMTADIVDEFKLIHGDTHTLVFHSNIQHRLVIDPKIFRLIVTHLLSDSVKSSESRIDVNMMEDQTGIELEIRNQGAETPDDTGLPVVKQAVEMCGGSIYVEEVGTRFVVQFPREEVGHD